LVAAAAAASADFAAPCTAATASQLIRFKLSSSQAWRFE
jgi:hypothetical protein